MKKLLQGIVEFRKSLTTEKQQEFARLALGQKPDTLFIACSDSRVVPNLFASVNPGDLFVTRNVGNLIPICGPQGHSEGDESELAALEFALENLKVSNIVVCGHSECGAMQAVVQGREKVAPPHLRSWLKNAEPSLEKLASNTTLAPERPIHNRLSQLNVLQQIEHLKSYPLVQEYVEKRHLHIHGWWFDIATASVYAYEADQGQFVLIDSVEAKKLLAELE